MVFMNATGIIGIIIATGTQNLTGNIVASLFLILMFLIAVALVFGLPLEFMAVIFLPLCMAMGAYYSNFMVVIIGIIILVSTIIAKNWLFR